MQSFSEKFEVGRENNLNLIRLVLAFFVIFDHSFMISLGDSSAGDPLVGATHGQMPMGGAAVNLFFFLSGTLITASWFRSASLRDFLLRRILRIYPAFLLAMIFSAVVILMCCGEFRDSIGLGISWAQVFLRNCILLGSSSLSWDGVFVNNPTSGMANASLWTIQKEFQCYLLVAALGGFGLLRFRWLILLFSFLALLIHARASLAGSNTTFSDSRLTTYFLFGVSTWLWRDKIPYSKWLGVLSLLVLLAASKQPPWFSILFVFAGGYLTFFSGYGPSLAPFRWTQGTDLSYAVYLYGWPVQQIFATNSDLRVPFINFLLSSLVVTLIAFVSWRVVEKPFLRLKGFDPDKFDPGDRKSPA